jgi:putative transposase
MPHSYNKIWLHVVFACKERSPLIKPSVEKQLYEHMREQLVELGCPVRIINGMPDHVHLLFLQNPKMAVTDILKQVKGNTSHWVNSQNIIAEKFAWQQGYSAFFQYIRNQKEHHAKKTFAQEYAEFIAAHGLTAQIENKNG